jgi:GNAT superfamily N-acetyltransferase
VPATLDNVTDEDWEQILGDEEDPWGNAANPMTWSDKDRQVATRDAQGRMLSVAASATVPVRVEGHGEFEVLGIGGVFVRRDQRGRGLARDAVEAILALGSARPVERAMLFCLPDRMGLYEKFDFRKIHDPVWADQPDGRVRMGLEAMWKPLVPGVGWPPGRVDVIGLPF